MKRVFALLAALAFPAPPSGAQELVLSAADSTAQSPVLVAGANTLVDTVRRRPKAVEVSEAYELRLRIHRYASWATVPLFVAQSVAGNQLFQADKSGASRPSWAQSLHGAGAVGLGALFTVNTVTGVWNLWDSRSVEAGRTKRLLHSALMLGSGGGFAYTGIALASDARRNLDRRTDHRNVAYWSMGAALVGYGIMLIGDH